MAISEKLRRLIFVRRPHPHPRIQSQVFMLIGKNKTARAVTVLSYEGLIISCVTNR